MLFQDVRVNCSELAKLGEPRLVVKQGETQSEETACYVDELNLKHIGGPRKASAIPGRIPTSPLTRKDDPNLGAG